MSLEPNIGDPSSRKRSDVHEDKACAKSRPCSWRLSSMREQREIALKSAGRRFDDSTDAEIFEFRAHLGSHVQRYQRRRTEQGCESVELQAVADYLQLDQIRGQRCRRGMIIIIIICANGVGPGPGIPLDEPDSPKISAYSEESDEEAVFVVWNVQEEISEIIRKQRASQEGGYEIFCGVV
jgi:hypothetical protein